MRSYGIPNSFPDEVLAELPARGTPDSTQRIDLRHLHFVTIDPEDARDRDDSVFAHSDTDPKNPGGYVIWVAIADVAHFVQPESAIDREARARGNSTYFPDFAVPMLPDLLSGDLCSLHENVDRPCIAVRVVLTRTGKKIRHEFIRGLMCSRMALSYESAQGIVDETIKVRDAEFKVLRDLRAAFKTLRIQRDKRNPLNIESNDQRVYFDDLSRVTAIRATERLDSHRMIEEFMVLANICAAETLEKHGSPCIFRVHDQPDDNRIPELLRAASSCGLRFSRSAGPTTAQLNALLAAAAETDCKSLMNQAVLRLMQQAIYTCSPGSHFGLNLRRYAHFTSPIRRYSDLMTHRLLIRALNLGEDGAGETDLAALEKTARHISSTERRSAAAERDTLDRFAAACLADRVGTEFNGILTGVKRFGAFVRLDETQTDGLIPISRMRLDHLRCNPDNQTLVGVRNGKILQIGQRVRVTLIDANPSTGSISLALNGERAKMRRKRRRQH